MEIKELDELIRYHEAALRRYRQLICPSDQYMEEKTVEALKELREIKLRGGK